MLPKEIRTKLLSALSRRIYAEDGMALTHDVWNDAHGYEAFARQLRWHQHPGILFGLEVQPSTPADSRIHIQPGAAIDPSGRLIVLMEKSVFNLQQVIQPGCWRVWLKFDEGQQAHLSNEMRFEGLNVKHYQQVPEVTVGQGRTDEVCIEVARIHYSPDANPLSVVVAEREIDQRFRRYADEGGRPVLAAAVVCLGQSLEAQAHDLGALARVVSGAEPFAVVMDRLKAFPSDLEPYDLLFVVTDEAAQLSQTHKAALHNFLRTGGTVWLEVAREKADATNPPQWVTSAFEGFDLPQKLALLHGPEAHPLLNRPHLFAQLPRGVNTSHTPHVWGKTGNANVDEVDLGQGLLLSDAGYARVWQGDAAPSQEAPMREVIRAAHELGANLLTLAARRRLLIDREGERRRGL